MLYGKPKSALNEGKHYLAEDSVQCRAVVYKVMSRHFQCRALVYKVMSHRVQCRADVYKVMSHRVQ